jgi:hypothetical protein
MPVISMFYGIIVLMYSFDDKQHLSRTSTWNMARRAPCWRSRLEKCSREPFGRLD